MFKKMLFLVCFVLSLAVPSLAGLSSADRIDKSNFKAFFNNVESKGGYLEGATGLGGNGSKYLGLVTTNKYKSKSIANSYGEYGSKYQETIFNKFGDYGSKYSSKSCFNKHASDPPAILYRSGKDLYIVGYLTSNTYHVGDYAVPNVDPVYLFTWLDRLEDLPD